MKNDSALKPKNEIYLSFLERVLGVFIFLTLFLYFINISKKNINWDEFNYLSQIYSHKEGRPLVPLQTFHIHFFSWLLEFFDNEIYQIILARYIVFFFFLGGVYLLFNLSLKYGKKTEALFVIFLVLSHTDIIRHGYSFRPDPICLFFFLLTIYFIIKNSLFSFYFSGFTFSICLLFSIKSIFYIPTIFLIFFFFKDEKPKNYSCTKKISLFLFSLILFFSILFLLHNFSLIGQKSSSNFSGGISKAENLASSAIDRMFWTGKLFPQRGWVIRSLIENYIICYIFLFGFYNSIKNIINKKNILKYCFYLSFALPLLTISFYRNSFPYYWVFVLPPALLTAVAYTALDENLYEKSRKSIFIILFLPVLLLSFNSIKFLTQEIKNNSIKNQKKTIELIHQLFPTPTPYIDGRNMVPSFPQAGIWMSTLGMETYRSNGIPVMRNRIEKYQPKLLLVNVPALDVFDENYFLKKNNQQKLFYEDYSVLKNNFIEHWGLIYVPGKIFDKINFLKKQKFEILIEGLYTIESNGRLKIDDNQFNSNDKLFLTKGEHKIESSNATLVVLRFGSNLIRPDSPPPKKPFFENL